MVVSARYPVLFYPIQLPFDDIVAESRPTAIFVLHLANIDFLAPLITNSYTLPNTLLVTNLKRKPMIFLKLLLLSDLWVTNMPTSLNCQHWLNHVIWSHSMTVPLYTCTLWMHFRKPLKNLWIM
ncbi:hypothetical protein BC941DRAFT_506504 [Chlamydoabsidia padenii]|nr:hypothetical protein BC941DRAFT_506504 [Chlamydoabsidia padenii]